MVRRDALKEYVAGALWVLPSMCAVIALAAGFTLSHIQVGLHSRFSFLAFQGTADDARTLLITIAGTVVTVIALVLGLTVVALQLSSTQFSPRLLRNFLRDRSTQRVLSVFLSTFAYSAAGLYTVGVQSGNRVQDFPRLAVSGAMLLLFASLTSVVLYANHLAHSIQIDAIARHVEHATLRVVEQLPTEVDEQLRPTPAEWAVPITSSRSGYLQTARMDQLLSVAVAHRVCILVRQRVGEHVVAGSTVAWVWTLDREQPQPDPLVLATAVEAAVRVGFERTLEQDAGFGIRQLVDVACKALSPAINDPYTAIQAVDHLSVIFCALADRPLGPIVARDAATGVVVVSPARVFEDYLATMCGPIRRYGASEPTVGMALLRLLHNCAARVPDRSVRRAALVTEADLILVDTERLVGNPADVVQLRASVAQLGAETS